MQPNVFYYVLSAIPQILAAIAAILWAFIHFRINTLTTYLVGDGQSVLYRWGDTGYKFLKKVKDKAKDKKDKYEYDQEEDIKQHKRMKDAVARRSRYGIGNVISLLSDIEKKQGYTKKERPRGLQYLYEDRFLQTNNLIDRLGKWTFWLIRCSFITITLSIFTLLFIDKIISCNKGHVVLSINMILFVLSLILAYYLIHLSFLEKAAHEKDRKI